LDLDEIGIVVYSKSCQVNLILVHTCQMQDALWLSINTSRSYFWSPSWSEMLLWTAICS